MNMWSIRQDATFCVNQLKFIKFISQLLIAVGAGGGVVWDNILETFSFDHFVVLPSPCKDGDIAFYNKSDLTFVTIEHRSSSDASLDSRDLNLLPCEQELNTLPLVHTKQLKKLASLAANPKPTIVWTLSQTCLQHWEQSIVHSQGVQPRPRLAKRGPVVMWWQLVQGAEWCVITF